MTLNPESITIFNRLTRQNKFGEALDFIKALLAENPDDLDLLSMTAKLANRQGQTDTLIDCLKRLVSIKGVKADDLYNAGYQLSRLGKYQEALKAYTKSLKQNVARPEDVHLNMGVIYADHLLDQKLAEIAFKTAINLNPSFPPPYINLGNLYEETGRFEAASKNYQTAIENIPNAFEAMARLANSQDIKIEDHPTLRLLEKVIHSPQASAFDKECLHFALGTAYDGLRNYEKALENYTLANAYGRKYGLPYPSRKTEAYFDTIKSRFNAPNAVQDSATDLAPQPIFICGMFRSGSTLLEQVLAAHPDVSPKGELDFFSKLVASTPDFFPNQAATLTNSELSDMRTQYLNQSPLKDLRTRFFTDKRPDNFLYIGLIKRLFPQSKIIHTYRNPLDNYLSIYFTQFGEAQAYARQLQDIADYHALQKNLMIHWDRFFGDDILHMSYDDFVSQPNAQTEKLLNFLGLAWDSACLNFHTQRNRVKTASYKQVRRPLYKTSSGRVKNYQPYLPDIKL